MVCSHCQGAFAGKHNSRTCPLFLVFKESEAKKVTKTFERLADCASMFKEPKGFYEKKKVFKICSMCGIAGHNKRTCVLVCRPCIVHADMPTKAEVRVAQSLSELLC